MARDRSRGAQRSAKPLSPAMQMWCARKLARVLRNEFAMGYPPLIMFDGSELERDLAAERLEDQANRWQKELQTGVLNTFDRERMGF
jgi:hypothetical protein